MTPMPIMARKRHGSPPPTPAWVPAAVSMMLLGLGVIEATTAKKRNATALFLRCTLPPPSDTDDASQAEQIGA